MATVDESTPLTQVQPTPVAGLKNRPSVFSAILMGAFILCLFTIVWSFLFPVLVVTQIFSYTPNPIRRLSYRYIGYVTAFSQSSIIAFLEFILGVRYLCYGDVPEHKNETALMIMNHPSNWDWLYLWGWLARYGGITNYKILMKAEIRTIPLLGWALQSSSHLFLARKWAEDQNQIHSLVEYWRLCCPNNRCNVLIFPEGTNLGKHSIPKAIKYCEDNNIPAFEYVLPPKSTGTSELLVSLTGLKQKQLGTSFLFDSTILTSLDGSMIDAIYDMTIAYTNTYADKQVNPMGGSTPVSVHVHCKRIPIRTYFKDIIEQAKTIEEQASEASGAAGPRVTQSGIARDVGAPVVNSPSSTHHTSASNHTGVEKSVKVSRTSFDQAIHTWLMDTFRAKDERLKAFYNSPRLTDTSAPPLLDSELLLPCDASKQGRRVEPQYSLFSKDLRLHITCLAGALVLITTFLQLLFMGYHIIWIWVLVLALVSYVCLNVCKFKLDHIAVNAAKMYNK